MVSSLSRKICAVLLTCCTLLCGIHAQSGTISCIGDFNLSLNTCETVITPQMISAGTLANTADYTVILKNEHGDTLVPANVVPGAEKGKQPTIDKEVIFEKMKKDLDFIRRHWAKANGH